MNVLRQEIRTGILVVFSLAVLFVVLLYIGAPGVFVPQKTFYIYVKNAFGLKQGADVAVAGRKVGQVVQLYSPVVETERPAPDLETMVEVRVSRAAQIYNKVNVQITSSSLLGEYFVDFTAGQAESGEAPAKHAFVGAGPNNISDAVPKILERIDPLVKEATLTLSSLQKTAQNIDRITAENGDAQLAIAEFRKVGTNLNAATGQDGALQKTLENVRKLTADTGSLSVSLENIKTMTGPEGSLNRTLKNAEKFTADLNNNKDIKLTLENSRKATAELNTTLNDLRFKFNTVADNLSQASDTVKRQPWRLIWPSTKKYDEPAVQPVVQRTSTRTTSAAPARSRRR